MTPIHLAAIYNDIIATAGATVDRMHSEGHINDRWRAQIIAQLNATLYTLGFALPPGTIAVENTDTGAIRECVERKVERKYVRTKDKAKADPTD